MPVPHFSRRAAVDATVIALFLAGICAPSIDKVLRPDEARGPFRELRSAAPKPVLALDSSVLTAFPERYEAWYKDTFGLRDMLLRWNSIEKLELLHVSPTPKVVLGEDDWVFYTDGHSMEVWRGVEPFTPGELEAWCRMFERNRDRLKDLGVDYVFAFGPNKESIYPEHVARRFNRVGPTRMDQLVAYLASHSDLHILDLRPALLEAKKEDKPGDWLYFRDGTHWDARGILVAYRELIARLAESQPGLLPLDASRLEAQDVPGTLDSWSDTMYVYDRRPQGARQWRILPSPDARTLAVRGAYGAGQVKLTERKAPNLPRVLFIHDSFGNFLDDLLAESVGRLASHWTNGFDVSEVEAERPDVVVHLLVERALVELRPDLVQMRIPPTSREAFEASSQTLFSLDPARDPPQLSAWREATCRSAADDAEPGLEIGIHAPKDLVLLPELESGDGLAVSVDVTAPARTTLILFFKHDPQEEYLRKRSVSVPLEAGRNRVYLRLDSPAIRGRLGLRPGAANGSYLLQALEIRRLAGKTGG